MRFPRSAGLLMHLTSLPGQDIGDLGAAARDFLGFLKRSDMSLWQMLPIGPVGFGGSPYQSTSSFAGNPLLVSPEGLLAEGWLTEEELPSAANENPEQVQFDRVMSHRGGMLRKAGERFQSDRTAERQVPFHEFRAHHASWLDDFALFVALKDEFGEAMWTEWEPALVKREPGALQHWSQKLAAEIERVQFAQWQFDRQWRALRDAAHANGLKLVGDLPVFVAQDSADVWANQELFELDDAGRPTVVAGVPPDYFSATGQLWGNPLYRWARHEAQNFHWWTRRLARILQLFDIVRIDHFRGFEAHWEIPADAPDASHGRWVKGPGARLFRAAEASLGPLPVIAEDLGLITKEVDELREELEFPGMRVLQFSFGDPDPESKSRPHMFPENCIVYTGTHDNDTTVGWFRGDAGEGTTRSAEDIDAERARVLEYLGTDGHDIHWDLICLAFENHADVAVVPVQDLLGLPGSARMNRPGIATGNWNWRLKPGLLTPELEQRLSRLATTYGRQLKPHS